MKWTMDREEKSLVNHTGSWGSTKPVERTMKITAWICEERERGGFEIYDLETRGEQFYGEGMLQLDSKKHLVDYDGVYSLDRRIIEWLDSLGLISNDEKDFFRRELTQ